MKYIAILGNTPELSALEIQRLDALEQWRGGSVAELTKPVSVDALGGTIKIAEVVATLPRSTDGIDELFDGLQQTETEGKLVFGFSVYAGDPSVTNNTVKTYSKQLERVGLAWKKRIRDEFDRSVRFVTSKDTDLSSVIVHKEKLLDHKTDFVFAVFKKEIIVARTTEVQDYKDYAERDYGRPEVDPQSGMLPPKVAKMLVNIAHPAQDEVILDAFCGSGTVLLEAAELGYEHIIGSDKSSKAIEDSQANIAWRGLDGIELHVSEVQKLSQVLPAQSVHCVVGEGYLGPIRPKKTDKVVRQMQKLYEETFAVLPAILAEGGRVVLGVPAWQRHDQLQTLELDAVVKKNGFVQFHEPIFYGRDGARVVRQFWFLSLQNKSIPA